MCEVYNKYNRKHVKYRFKQRYSLKINTDDILRIESYMKKRNRYNKIFLCYSTSSKNRNIYLCVFDGKFYPIVYDKYHKELITVLPFKFLDNYQNKIEKIRQIRKDKNMRKSRNKRIKRKRDDTKANN